MDGVERIMVLGIFAVIVAILGVAAWSVTQDDLGGTNGQQQSATALAKSEVTGPQDLVGGNTPAGRRTTRGLPGMPSQQVLLQRPDDRGEPKQPELAQRDQLAAGAPGGVPVGAGAQAGKGRDLLADRSTNSLDRAGTGRETLDLGPRGGSTPVSLRADTKNDLSGVDDAKKSAPVLVQPTYTVREHDTLWSIASAHVSGSATVKAKLAQVLALNPGLDADHLAVGRVIKLPGAAVAAPAVAQPAEITRDGTTRLYTVASGDSLSSIAKEHLGSEGRWNEIFQLNSDRLSSPSKVFVGQTLRLPGK